MMLCTFVLRRYNNELNTSEVFSTAGRTVKTGLVSAAVVSSWTWAATVMQSSAIAYRYGVSGGFWYASGATAQILLFATLAIELKRKAPNAHTVRTVVDQRRELGLTHQSVPRSDSCPLRRRDTWSFHRLRPRNEYSGYSYVAYGRLCSCKRIVWSPYRSSLLPAVSTPSIWMPQTDQPEAVLTSDRRCKSSGSRPIHHLWRYQGHVSHRLRLVHFFMRMPIAQC